MLNIDKIDRSKRIQQLDELKSEALQFYEYKGHIPVACFNHLVNLLQSEIITNQRIYNTLQTYMYQLNTDVARTCVQINEKLRGKK